MSGDIVGQDLVLSYLDFDPLGVTAAPAGTARRRSRLFQRCVGAIQPRRHLVQRVLELTHAKKTVLQFVTTVAHRISQT